MSTPDNSISFFVMGEPKPKGSKRAFVVNGRAIVTEGKSTKSWEATIRTVIGTMNVTMLHGPVEVELVFYLPTPASRMPKIKSKDYWKRHPVPDGKPDLDKCVRAVFDAMNKVLFEDDARVIRLVAEKRFSAERPGVQVTVREAPKESE